MTKKQIVNHCLAVFICVLMTPRAPAGEPIAFSPDAKLMAMGWGDGRIELRDSATGVVQASFQHEGVPDFEGPVSAVRWTPSFAFSPDGKLLASSCGYAPVILWEPETGKKIRALSGRSVGYDLTFSTDGSRLIGIGVDSKAGPHRLTLWDTKTGKELQSLTIKMTRGPQPNRYKRNRIERARFSESGSVLVIDTYEDEERLIRVWNARTGKETLKIETDPDYFPPWFFSPDGKVLITRDHSRQSGHPEQHVLYDTATGQVIKRWNAAGDTGRSKK